MIAVIDYGAGNLRSVTNALSYLNMKVCIASNAKDLAKASRIILPGVGHFGHLTRSLDQLKLRQPLLDAILSGVPFLGICLGFQILFDQSEEDLGESGLGIFAGKVRRFNFGFKVPHMGWNQLQMRKIESNTSQLFKDVSGAPSVYFAHSYFVPFEKQQEQATTICEYGETMVASIEQKNVFGVQFHPEKSGEIGLHILKNFAEIRC